MWCGSLVLRRELKSYVTSLYGSEKVRSNFQSLHGKTASCFVVLDVL